MAEQAADQAHDQLFAATSSWQAEHARATMLATELDQCEMRLDEAERLVQHGRAHADHLQGSLIKARSQQRQQQREFEDALDEAHELAAEHVDNVWHQFQQNKVVFFITFRSAAENIVKFVIANTRWS
jgi:exonuclease VII small subunit